MVEVVDTRPQRISLRDYFAGQALTGMLANPHLKEAVHGGLDHSDIAEEAYKFADSLLKARKNYIGVPHEESTT